MQKGVDYIGVGVGAIILNEKNQVFMSKRGKKCRNEVGLWEFPGGAVEFGHSLEDSIRREVKEEFGIEIEVLELFDVCNHIIKNENQHWVSPTFLCKIKQGTPQIMEPEKCDEIDWVELEDVDKRPLSLVTANSLPALRQKFSK